MAEQYTEKIVGYLVEHKFVKLTEINSEFAELQKKDTSKEPFNYMLEIYMYDYIVLAIPKSQDELNHVANAIMTGIHDVLILAFWDIQHNVTIHIYLQHVIEWFL